MGFDIYELFGTSEETAKEGMTDALKAGGNAALGWLEQQAINLLQADKEKHEAVAQSTARDLLERPSNPNSFGSYLSNLMQNPALQTYGPYVLVGTAIILGIGYFIGRK